MAKRDEVHLGEAAVLAVEDGSATVTQTAPVPAGHAPGETGGANELLAKTLLEVVGLASLARYAAAQTDDPRLKGLFQRLAAAEERQERLLRVQAAAAFDRSNRAPRRWLGVSRGVAVACVAAASAGASVAAGVAVAARRGAARRAVLA